jgi:peptide deformylase
MSAWLASPDDPVLTTPAADLMEDEFGPELYQLVRAMLDLMYRARGIGLAASQISVVKRVIVFDTGTGPNVMVNPAIVSAGEGQHVHVEGCLSLPGVTRAVERPDTVTVRSRGLTGAETERTVSGLMAVVVQHEVDHTRGVLMTAHPAVQTPVAVDHPTPL